MSMRLFELKQERSAALDSADAIVARAEAAGRNINAEEKTLFDARMAEADRLTARIEPIQALNTTTGFGLFAEGKAPSADAAKAQASGFRKQFGSWLSNSLTTLDGGSAMEATMPSGPISIGSGTGLESVAITVPTEILPLLTSYTATDSFGAAGASQFFTDHTRPLFKPVLSAGAADTVYAENTAPSTSQPFGLSGFTFGGSKYSRLVLASYESLMNSELPLQDGILDELLSSLATTLTTATTVSLNAALTAASSALQVGDGGSNDIYSSMIDLRHAVPPRFDLPANKWMLSRASLAAIRNKRATSSGVPMFDPDANQIFGRDYVINDNFDSVCGAGFVVFGSWADGCWLRRTPVVTRVFQELYAQSGQVGYRTTQWADAHFLAELVGAPQPPTFQPLYYTSVASES